MTVWDQIDPPSPFYAHEIGTCHTCGDFAYSDDEVVSRWSWRHPWRFGWVHGKRHPFQSPCSESQPSGFGSPHDPTENGPE